MTSFGNLALFLCGINLLFELSPACSVTDDLSRGILHILSTSNTAISNNFQLVSMLNGSIVTQPDSGCPAECLIQLVAMERSVLPHNHTITMARPAEVSSNLQLGYYIRPPLPETQPIYCAPTYGWCGATANLYRYLGFTQGVPDYYFTTAIQKNATYALDNFGIPVCFIWDGSSTSSSSSSSSKDKWKWAGILLGVAIAALLIIGLLALITVLFIKSGEKGSTVNAQGLYQGEEAETAPRPVQSQQTNEPVDPGNTNQPPQQHKNFDISDPRGDVP